MRNIKPKIMKKLLIPLVFLFLFSCQQIDLEYSCDPQINQIVVENFEEFSQISVVELSDYDDALQRAIFKSWDYQKKREAWLDKLNLVLQNEIFNSSETEHIHKLIDHIEPNYFTEEFIDKNSKLILSFADEWINYATESLHWTDEFIAFLVYRLYTEQSQFEEELSDLKLLNKATISNSEMNCNCNVSADFCDYMNCKSTGCYTASGCGWFFSQACNGYCGN